jgi:hypothetical protein
VWVTPDKVRIGENADGPSRTASDARRVRHPESAIKVQRVLDQLVEYSLSEEKLCGVFTPIGLDIGADAPMEIVVSVLAEVPVVLRQRKAAYLRVEIAAK